MLSVFESAGAIGWLHIRTVSAGPLAGYTSSGDMSNWIMFGTMGKINE